MKTVRSEEETLRRCWEDTLIPCHMDLWVPRVVGLNVKHVVCIGISNVKRFCEYNKYFEWWNGATLGNLTYDILKASRPFVGVCWNVGMSGRVLRGPSILHLAVCYRTYDGRDRWLCVWKLPGTHASIHTHKVKHIVLIQGLSYETGARIHLELFQLHMYSFSYIYIYLLLFLFFTLNSLPYPFINRHSFNRHWQLHCPLITSPLYANENQMKNYFTNSSSFRKKLFNIARVFIWSCESKVKIDLFSFNLENVPLNIHQIKNYL